MLPGIRAATRKSTHTNTFPTQGGRQPLACDTEIGMMTSMSGINCMAVLKALSEPTRMRIVRLLLKQPLGVNDISGSLGVSQYNVSKHLRILREAGLLETEKKGKLRLYGIASELADRLASNRNVLELDCCTFRFDKLPR